MIRAPGGVARVLAAAGIVVAVAAGAGCDGGPDAEPAAKVKDLRLASDAEREAAERLHEAEVFLGQKKERLAEPLLRRVLELTPQDRRAAELLAQCLIARGKVDEAVPHLRRVLEGGQRAAAVRALLVQALTSSGDLAGAEEAARAWTGVDGQNADAWFELGRSLYLLGRAADAIPPFRRAETLKSGRADIRSELGLALAATGKLAQAESKFRDALEREPEYADAWFRLGDVILRQDRTRVREAIEAMDRAVTIQKQMAVGHLYLFRACRLAEPPDGDPLRARGETAWAAVLRIHGRAQLAPILALDAPDETTSEFALRQQSQRNPSDPAPLLALGRLLLGAERHDEAIDAYRRAIESGAEGAGPRLRLAAAYVVARRPAEAEAECRAALAAAPQATAPTRLLAWALLLQGKDADARVVAEAALAGAPDDVLARKIIALARMHQGELDAGLQEIAALGWL